MGNYYNGLFYVWCFKKVILDLYVIFKYNFYLYCFLYEESLILEGSKVESLFFICFIVCKIGIGVVFEKRKYSCFGLVGLYEEWMDVD